MCLTDVSLSQADLFVVLWSCRKSELKGPGGRERSAASRGTTGLVTEQKAALPSQAPCFGEGQFKEQGHHKPLKWSALPMFWQLKVIRSE